MNTIQNESVVMFDVDDTLVCWDAQYTEPDELKKVKIVDPYDNKTLYLHPHAPHIKLLKNHKARGSTVIVWSQGGYKWAEAVVTALGLNKYVDLIMTKPRAYVDDLPVQDWLTERIYISPDSNWGRGE